MIEKSPKLLAKVSQLKRVNGLQVLAWAVFGLCVFLHGAAVAETPVKVGVVLPLTGGVADYGIAVRNGITLAMQQQPDAFQNVRFIFEDSRYDNTHAITVFQKLLSVDGVDLAFVWGYGPVQAVAPMAESRRIPLLAATADSSLYVNQKYILRFCVTDQQYAAALLQHLRAAGLKKLTVVITEAAFLQGVAKRLEAQLNDDESVEFIGPFQPGDNDFRSTITRLRHSKFDALGIFLMPGQISRFYRQMAELRLEAATFGTDFFDSGQEIKDAGSAAENAVFSALGVSEDFAAKYRARFSSGKQLPWAGNGFDLARLMAFAFKQPPDNDSPDTIMSLLKSAPPMMGAAGMFGYQKTAHSAGFNFPVVIKIVRGGRSEVLK